MIQSFGLEPASFGKPSLGGRETVPKVRSAEGTQYLLQQKDPLSMFGQMVCSEAALDACPNHNGIIEIFRSSHDAH